MCYTLDTHITNITHPIENSSLFFFSFIGNAEFRALPSFIFAFQWRNFGFESTLSL